MIPQKCGKDRLDNGKVGINQGKKNKFVQHVDCACKAEKFEGKAVNWKSAAACLKSLILHPVLLFFSRVFNNFYDFKKCSGCRVLYLSLKQII